MDEVVRNTDGAYCGKGMLDVDCESEDFLAEGGMEPCVLYFELRQESSTRTLVLTQKQR